MRVHVEAEPWKVREGTCSAIIERQCGANAGLVGTVRWRLAYNEQSVLLFRAGKHVGYVKVTCAGQNKDQALIRMVRRTCG